MSAPNANNHCAGAPGTTTNTNTTTGPLPPPPGLTPPPQLLTMQELSDLAGEIELDHFLVTMAPRRGGFTTVEYLEFKRRLLRAQREFNEARGLDPDAATLMPAPGSPEWELLVANGYARPS